MISLEDSLENVWNNLHIFFMLVIATMTTGKDKTYLMEKFKIYILRKHKILFNSQCAYQ